MDKNARMRLQHHVVESKADEFGYAQAGSEAQVQHGSITDARPVNRLGCIEQRLDLLRGQVPHQARVGLLRRYGEDALDLFQCRRRAILHKVHERLDRSKTYVAGARAVAPGRLEMVKEVDHHRGIELFQFQAGRGGLQALLAYSRNSLNA